MTTEPVDTLDFVAKNDTLGFVETTHNRWKFKPEIELVRGRQYRIEIYPEHRFVLKQLLADGWATVIDAPTEDH